MKSQYIGEDWAENVAIDSYDSDPVCVNVNITFGKRPSTQLLIAWLKKMGSGKFSLSLHGIIIDSPLTIM